MIIIDSSKQRIKKVSFANLLVGDLFIRTDDKDVRVKVTKNSYLNLSTSASGGIINVDSLDFIKVEGELEWWIP
jgi:hypothetical protein